MNRWKDLDTSPSSWDGTFLDWDGDNTPAPSLLNVSDGSSLLYQSMSHTIFAPAGSGKSWLAVLLALQHLQTDHAVLYIDFEASWPVIRNRLLLGGLDADVTSIPFDYLHPTESPVYGDGIARVGFARNVLNTYDTDVVIIDGVTSAYALMGLDDNSARDTRLLYQALIEPFETAGATVLCIDHTAKADGGTPLGSGQKTAWVTGAEYALKVKRAPSKKTETSAGQIGRLELIVSKDRHGARAKGDVAAVFTIDGVSDPGRVALALEPPQEGSTGKAGPMPPEQDPVLLSKLYHFVLDNPNMTPNAIAEQAGGRKQANLSALASLTERGVVERHENEKRKGSYVLTAKPIPDGVSVFDADLTYVPQVSSGV